MLTRDLDLVTGAVASLADQANYPFVPHVIVEMLPYANASAPTWSTSSGYVNRARGE
jgi:hypothetical protein